ncbi:MAG: nucleoside recognition domain-containing protein [Clostridia bacterium]
MNYIMPALILLLVLYGLYKKVDIYDAFVSGAAEALPLLARIVPYMAAMLIAMRVLRGSGAMEFITSLAAPVFKAVGMPPELVALFVLRPFSGSAAMGLLADVYKAYGTDSHLGYAASIMLGSTETIFYTIALYFGSVKITKTRHCVPVALISGAVGAAASLMIAAIVMGSN